MTALTLFTQILPKIGLSDSSPAVTSGDDQTKLVVGFMNEAGQEISRRTEWSKLFAEQTIAGSVSSAALAAGFRKIGKGGSVNLNKSDFTAVRRITSPTDWQFITTDPSAQLYYFLDGGSIHFSNTLDSDGAKMRYLSEYWVGGTKAAIDANGDTFQFPESLIEKGTIWRYRRHLRQDYADYQAEFEADLQTEINAARGL